MGKKRICLITNWYPTKENPYAGGFFKEQAFAMQDSFDYLVLHIHEHKRLFLTQYLLRKLRGRDVEVCRVNEEKNTVEYDIHLYYSLYLVLFERFYKLYLIIRGGWPMEIGQCSSPLYQRCRKHRLEKAVVQKLKEPFDVLYCVDAQSESSTLQMISEMTHVPYIVSEHAPCPWPGAVLTDDEHAAMEQADLFLAISQDKIRQVMMQNVHLRRIVYVGNMVDETQFALAPHQNEVKTFIIVAANAFFKNYDLFIAIMNRLTEITEVPFKVMIVGYAANKGYSQNVEQLENAIRNSAFARNAELIPEISHDRIHELYARADAFIMTSIQEGQPVSAMEAGCCGLPIFSTMCGGVEDYVTEDIGRIYPIMDCEGFAAGLKDFLEGKIQFDNRHIRETVVGRFGKRAFVENFTRVLQDVIETRGGRR